MQSTCEKQMLGINSELTPCPPKKRKEKEKERVEEEKEKNICWEYGSGLCVLGPSQAIPKVSQVLLHRVLLPMTFGCPSAHPWLGLSIPLSILPLGRTQMQLQPNLTLFQ